MIAEVAIVGIIAGLMSGLFGIGGGLVMVPMLVALLGIDILNANAASLAAMLLPVGILGVVTYYKAGYIQIKDSLWISAGLLAGSYLGARVALSLNIHLLAKFYALFLLYVSVSYLNIPDILLGRKKNGDKVQEKSVKHYYWQFISLGLFAGIIAGMFGKGGGVVIVPALTKLFRYEPKAASATSLAALQLPVGLPSVIVYAHNGYLNWMFAIIMACGLVAGVFFGSKIAIQLPGSIFKKIYAVFLIGVSVYMVIKYL